MYLTHTINNLIKSFLNGIFRFIDKMSLFFIIPSLFLSACEEVIEIDLDSQNSAFVVEAQIEKDSFCNVILSLSQDYFSTEGYDYAENAIIEISDGIDSEELIYQGDGIYTGQIITGTEERNYTIGIEYDGKIYEASSYLPEKTKILYSQSFKDESQSLLNPEGETVITIDCGFIDNPETENYYMILFLKENELLDDAFYLCTESNSNIGNFRNDNDTLRFSESIFYDGDGEVEIRLISLDKQVYNYFWQLNDIMFWKRRYMPPTPYNPESNISNGALGYFAAWSLDSDTIILE